MNNQVSKQPKKNKTYSDPEDKNDPYKSDKM